MIRWTSQALADLAEVSAYIAEDNPAAAQAWVNRLKSRVERASDFPRAGRRVPEFARDDIREVRVHSYRVVYRLEPDGITVLALREGHRLLRDTP